MPNLTISVFQALTLLADHYRHDENSNKLKQIMYMYLTGPRTRLSHDLLQKLLADPILATYDVCAAKQTINEDPVRRYFESHLSHNTLATSLDDLDIYLLHEYFNLIFDLMDENSCREFQAQMEQLTPVKNMDEYSDAIFQLKKSTSYESLKPEDVSEALTPLEILDDRKQKLILITKISYAILLVNDQFHSKDLPLDLYNSRPKSPYHPMNRGRKERLDLAQANELQEQDVRPHTRGIMRSYMPLPLGDALRAEEPSTYSRPADRYTYQENQHLSDSPHSMPKLIFENQITPFVGSISGTMLMHLKILALLLRHHVLPFVMEPGNIINKQLELYMKSFVSYMLYNAGGHSLEEFFTVFIYLKVQQEFKTLAGFASITLKNLFQDTNTAAFNKALEQTIVYNKNILQKKALHQMLQERITPVNIHEHETDADDLCFKQERRVSCSIFTPINIEKTENSVVAIAKPEPHKTCIERTIFSPEPPKNQYDKRKRKQWIPEVMSSTQESLR